MGRQEELDLAPGESPSRSFPLKNYKGKLTGHRLLPSSPGHFPLCNPEKTRYTCSALAATGQEDGCAVRGGGAEAGLTWALEREAVGHRDGIWLLEGVPLEDGSSVQDLLYLLLISSGWSLLGQMADVSEMKSL